MNGKNFKLLLILLFISFPIFLNAQNNQQGISSEDRKELEEKFKKLKTYRIDDDGTVVYRYREEKDEDNESQEKQPVLPITNKVKVDVNESGNYTVTSEEFIIENNVKKEGNSEEEEIINEQQETAPPLNDSETTETEKIEFEESSSVVEIDSASQNDASKNKVFRKKEPSYKSLEEAAMAVDNLLEELRKKQDQINNRTRTNSLSQKMTKGVDGSLRKNTPYSSGKNSFENEEYINGESVDYGEPIYYIDGVRVDKSEVDKLKPNQILRKKIKRSTSNPSGEWWIETQ